MRLRSTASKSYSPTCGLGLGLLSLLFHVLILYIGINTDALVLKTASVETLGHMLCYLRLADSR